MCLSCKHSSETCAFPTFTLKFYSIISKFYISKKKQKMNKLRLQHVSLQWKKEGIETIYEAPSGSTWFRVLDVKQSQNTTCGPHLIHHPHGLAISLKETARLSGWQQSFVAISIISNLQRPPTSVASTAAPKVNPDCDDAPPTMAPLPKYRWQPPARLLLLTAINRKHAYSSC